MDKVMMIVVLAITVEALVEYAKSIEKMAVEHNKRPLVIQLGALVAAVVLCLITGADLYNWLGVLPMPPIAGQILTGILASRGANFISDFIGRVRNPAPTFEIEGIPAEQLELE